MTAESAIHCVYHAGCPDGFASFWTVVQRYGAAMFGSIVQPITDTAEHTSSSG